MATDQAAAEPRTSSLSILSLIFGISGWTVLPFVGGIVAIVTGHMAKQEIRQSEGELGGDGIATAGLVLGYACVAFVGLLILLAVVLALLFLIPVVAVIGS